MQKFVVIFKKKVGNVTLDSIILSIRPKFLGRIGETAFGNSEFLRQPQDSPGQRKRDEHTPVGHKYFGRGEQERRMEAGERNQHVRRQREEEESEINEVRYHHNFTASILLV